MARRVLYPGDMNAKMFVSSVLFAAVCLGGCVGEESLPLAAEYDEDFGPALEVTPKPIRPPRGDGPSAEPALPPELAFCGGSADDFRGEVINGDFIVATPLDARELESVVVVTGNLRFTVDRPIDVSSLEEIRCVGGDVIVSSEFGDRFTDLPSLEYIGGSLVVED